MTRRAPLKRSPWKRKPAAPKRKSPLRPASREKQSWQRRYSAAKAQRMAGQIRERGCTYCERCRRNAIVDGHHPAGQIGELILRFFLLCRGCHDWAHDHPKLARAEGWLE